MWFKTVLSTSVFLLAMSQIARADVSLGAGLFVSQATTTGAAIVSLGLFKVPVVPISGEVTAAVPFNGSGYATTFDARFTAPDTTQIGAGIGFGNLVNTSSTNAIFDAIIAHGLIPHLSVEGRVYFGPDRPTSFTAGLRLTL